MAALLPFVGCSDDERPNDPEVVRFGVVQAIDLIPYFAMQDEGFAAARGLRLDGEIVVGGRAAVEAMLAGTIDAAVVGGVPWLMALRAGPAADELVAVAANSFADADHLGFAVLVGEQVRTWADLEGSEVAVNQLGSISDVALRVRLAREGVADVRIREIPFPNQGLALSGGNVAAVVLAEPYLTQSVLRGDGQVLDWIVGGDPFPELVQGVLVVRRALLDEHPEAVRRLLQAQLDAVEWIAGHEPEARSSLVRNLGVSTEVGDRVHLLRFPPDLRNDPGTFAAMQATLAEFDPSLVPMPTSGLYDEAVLDAVLAEGD